MKSNWVQVKKTFQNYDNATKSAGIYLLDLVSGEIVGDYGGTKEATAELKKLSSDGGFSDFKSRLGAVFPKRQPHIVTIKSEQHNHFYQFVDDQYLVFAMHKNENINFGKIKNELQKVCRSIKE